MITISKNKMMIAVCAIVATSSVLFGANEKRDYGYVVRDKGLVRLERQEQREKNIFKNIDSLRERMKNATDENEIRRLEKWLNKYEKAAEGIFVDEANPGMLVARGLAGDQWDILDGSGIESIQQGIAKGMMVRASKAAGDVLGKRLADACETVLGGAWDQVFGTLSDSWNTMNNVVFHGANKPMNQEDLAVWRQLIENVFFSLEHMLKNSLMNASRSADMSRRFDLGAMAGLNNEKIDYEEGAAEEQEEDIKESAWAFLMTGYTDQLNRLGSEVGARKAYYAEDSLEAFYIEQINQRLLKFSTILRDSVSINDLATRLDSNQSIVPAIKDNLNALIFQLDDLLRRKSHKKEDKHAYDRKRSGLNRTNNNRLGSSYPGSMMSEPSSRF